MRFKYLDAHTHAQFAAFDTDRDVVLARARETGVAMVNAGTNRATSAAAIALAEAYPDLCWATVGLHPAHTYEGMHHDPQELTAEVTFSNSRELENSNMFDFEWYKKIAAHPKVVGIGECGLDYAVFVSDRVSELQKRAPRQESGFPDEEVRVIKEKQREAFEVQIKLAHEVQKPLMIHCRSAFPDLISILTPNASRLRPSVIHFFSGTIDEAKALLNLGFSFTFGGVITFSRDYDEVIKIIPLDRILSETDAPYVAPAPYRGKRNEPAYVVEVVKKLAEFKNVSVEATAEQVLKNGCRVFGITI